MFKRLNAPTGKISEPGSSRPEDTPEKAVRSAILIHSGANGKKLTLASSDGDITFDENRIRDVVAKHNNMITKLAKQYGGFDKMPIGAYPPILDQHSDDSNDRIRGRLTGLLRFERRDVPKIGKNVACAVCEPTFLGKDTVDRVKDGRVYHLSVGIDENTNTLGEVSTVIDPAAPGAMILKKGAMKMGANKAKLAALREELKTLSAGSKKAVKTVRLAQRKNEVKARFTKLMADRKMTPAEFKRVDVKRLASLSKEDFDSVMHVYDARGVVLKAGQQGTTQAANFTAMGTAEDREVKRLKAAVKKSLASGGMKFKASEDDDKELEADEKDDKKLALEEDDKKKLAEGDQDDQSGEMEQAEDDGVNDEEKNAIMKQLEDQAAQIARLASMVDKIMEAMGDDDKDEDDSDDSASDDVEESDGEKDLAAEKDDDKKDDEEKDKKDEKEKGDK